ncbi:MAG: hypothetical protein Q8K78_03830 [Planctomycetaceae bacterium]|nr:hypothetical protein [Planctomycetaceae bacterium]
MSQKSAGPSSPVESKADPKHPVATFRIGYVSASVFVRDVEIDGETRQFHSCSLQKSFKDGDERKWTSSFNLAELPQALRCLQLAQAFVEAREAQIGSGE